MVVIEQEPEVEETPAAAEEPAAEEQAAGGAAGGEAARADGEDEEEAFEDALTDEQLREVVPWGVPSTRSPSLSPFSLLPRTAVPKS
jgi:hypothetical protein